MLVVEDEPVINRAVTDRLANEGFEVRQAYDGPSAVEVAARANSRDAIRRMPPP